MSTNKKGISSTALSRTLNLRQKICWLFRKKIVGSMKSSKQHPLTGTVEVEEMVLVNGKNMSLNLPVYPLKQIVL